MYVRIVDYEQMISSVGQAHCDPLTVDSQRLQSVAYQTDVPIMTVTAL